jgi:hypothetical protein
MAEPKGSSGLLHQTEHGVRKRDGQRQEGRAPRAASDHIIFTNILFKNIYHIKSVLNENPTKLCKSGVLDPAIYRQGCLRNYRSSKLGRSNKLVHYKSVGYEFD